MSRSPRTGSATRDSCAAWGSDVDGDVRRQAGPAPSGLRMTALEPEPELVRLPWSLPLEEWDGDPRVVDLPRWLLDDVSLLPVNMMRRPDASQRRTAELAPLVAAGELTVAVERFGLEDAAAAVARLRSGGVCGRVVLEPGAAGHGG